MDRTSTMFIFLGDSGIGDASTTGFRGERGAILTFSELGSDGEALDRGVILDDLRLGNWRVGCF